VVIDAQRNEFYRAAYEISQDACKEIEPLQIVGLAEVESRANAGDILIGPEATRWFPSGRVIFPHARTLGRLVAGRNDFVSGDKLAPIYLRATNFIKAPPSTRSRIKTQQIAPFGSQRSSDVADRFVKLQDNPPAVGLTLSHSLLEWR